MPLALPCHECAPDGYWVQGPDGMRRCACARGQMLAAADAGRGKPRMGEPGVSEEEATAAILQLAGVMRFVPAEPLGRMAVVREIQQFAANYDELHWVIEFAPRIFAEWPGVREMRALYCHRFGPLDGHSLVSEAYPEFYPEIVTGPRPEQIAVRDSRLISHDAELSDMLRRAAGAKTLPAAGYPICAPESLEPEYRKR